MKVNEQAIPAGPAVFYDKGFRDTLEAHMPYLRSLPNTRSAEVDPHKARVYEGDLFGFFNEITLPAHYHWITMRLNNLRSPHEFGEGTLTLLVPDEREIELILISYQSSR